MPARHYAGLDACRTSRAGEISGAPPARRNAPADRPRRRCRQRHQADGPATGPYSPGEQGPGPVSAAPRRWLHQRDEALVDLLPDRCSAARRPRAFSGRNGSSIASALARTRRGAARRRACRAARRNPKRAADDADRADDRVAASADDLVGGAGDQQEPPLAATSFGERDHRRRRFRRRAGGCG